MYIQKIKSETGCSWRIYAICNSEHDCSLEDFLRNQPPNLESNRIKMLALLDHVIRQGPQLLPDEICHQVGENIWEFIKGRLRILWFYDEGKMVVCSHGFVKKTQKTKKGDLEKAVEARKLYFKDKEAKKIVVVEDKE